jgi:hypothetical protein
MAEKIIMKTRDGQEGSITIDASNETVTIKLHRPDGASMRIVLNKDQAAQFVGAMQRELRNAPDHRVSDAVADAVKVEREATVAIMARAYDEGDHETATGLGEALGILLARSKERRTQFDA